MDEESSYEDEEEVELLGDGTIETLLPLNGVNVELDMHPSVLMAQEECDNILGGNEVEIVNDEQLQQPVVEVIGPEARLVFNCESVLQYLVLFVKNLDKFFDVEIEIIDDAKEYRVLKATNQRSLARIQSNRCQIPLKFGKGWRYMCIDLPKLVKQAFGTNFLATVQVRVFANTRIRRIFFQDKLYSDIELPAYLRVRS